ncbi:MAG: pyrroloquinoline quinone-dependent dehydrogenase [Fimbriimonadaceae bacterium]
MIGLLLLILSESKCDWPNYGNDKGGNRYSPANLITPENVSQLEVAWQMRTGDVSDGSSLPNSSFQCTPIMIDDVLYFSTPFSRVLAVDASTGAKKWSFDPGVDLPKAFQPLIHRGVSAWLNPKSRQLRIFIPTYDSRLIAIDAATGKPCPDFGNRGTVDLKRGLKKFVASRYVCYTPPAIVNGVVVVGSTIRDLSDADTSSGTVRAFDAVTGKLRWKFDPIAKGVGAGNAWAVMSADASTNTVFIPTSSQSPDFYGGLRPGDNRDSDSIVAVDATTGNVKWRYQVVHHDVWDYDIPAQPILAEIAGRKAVIVLTKMGLVFTLDRNTGKPIIETPETRVPSEGVAGEKLSKTQPIPSKPEPLSRTSLAPEDAWGVKTSELEKVKRRLEGYGVSKLYDPQRTTTHAQIPGTLGGLNWSGGSYDPRSNTLFVNINNMPTLIRLVKRSEVGAARAETRGMAFYEQMGTPYAVGTAPLQNGVLPAVKPPWGELVAINMQSGDIRWRKPFGYLPELVGNPEAKRWGSPSLGGSICTAGGLIFVSGTRDSKLRAISSESGEVLWEGDLPAGGNATPMTYIGTDGRQYVVICAGGHSGLSTKLGDYVIAFACPRRKN